jgi:DNA helicase II / ATP-dependent DNA helicase PcrA
VLELTAEQVEASRQLAGPRRLVAGAGTGKTAVIAERFRRLLDSGVDPAAILVMTFTERAASEMRLRITREAGGREPPAVGTFHSLALRWLREEASRAALPPGFSILGGPDRWILLRELMWELGDPALVGGERPDDLVAPLLKLQERLKQELVPYSRLAAFAGHVEDPERRDLLKAAARLFMVHADRCRKERLLDFDDLLVQVVRLFEGHPSVREHYADRFPWIMVDEYQDTNLAQERMVELLGGPAGNVCVVGDDDQSIYRFRGASRASMERFLACFPTAETRTLGRNRRSPATIVAAASRLIEHNQDRLAKPLEADPALGTGLPVEFWRFERGSDEATGIARAAGELVAGGLRPSQIAILVRAHALARPLAEALAQAGLPFRHLAGQGLMLRPEIRDVLAYLRLLRDPSDLLALSRLLVRPPLRADLPAALRLWREGDGDQEAEAPLTPLRALRSWAPAARWAETVEDLCSASASLGVDELLFELLERTGHLEHLVAACGSDDYEARRVSANVGRFAELVDDYCTRRRDHSLGQFVDYLELVLLSGQGLEEAEVEGAEDAVHLMTIHQAKGLEFEAVFVPSMVEGRLPQSQRREGLEVPPQLVEPAVRAKEDHVAEERRLCYVAMTRARSRLVLSWAEMYDGGRRWRPSRFLEEVTESGAAGVVRREPQPAAESPVELVLGEKPSPAGDPEAGSGLEAKPRLSFSAISAYRECPRQHWYRYQLRLPAAASLEAQFGTAVHVALMRAGRLRQQGRDVGLDLLQELYVEAWEEVGLAEPRRRPALEALGWRFLKRFWTDGGLSSQPLLVEVPFTTDLDTWTLRGIIDRVDELPPPSQEGGGWVSAGAFDSEVARASVVGAAGGLQGGGARGRDGAGARQVSGGRIVDYKTGRAVPASRLRRDLQLALYALGAKAALGLDTLELEIVYLRDGSSVRLAATDDLLAEAKRVGAEVAEGIRNGRFEARPERRRCSLCPYRLVCEAAL